MDIYMYKFVYIYFLNKCFLLLFVWKNEYEIYVYNDIYVYKYIL